jgi:ribose transport system ATP-binding protein
MWPPAGTATSLLEVRDVVKSFGGVTALRGVSLSFERGRVHAIAGENGAGKSTLVRVIMGVLAPDSGGLLIEGRPLQVAGPAVARMLGFAAVYQDALVYRHLSVLENLFIASPLCKRFGGLDWERMRSVASPVLERIGADPEMLRLRMGELRLGHQQLVLIAQALLQDAKLIIFDEPSAILSVSETKRLLEIIGILRDEGRALIYISHRVEELARIADEVTVLTDGAVVGHLAKEEMDVARVVKMMAGTGRRLYSEHPGPDRGAHVPGLVRLAVEGLAKAGLYEDVTFEVHEGEVLGLYGQVGAGRSEVALGIIGAIRPDRGSVLIEGKKVKFRSPRQAIRRGVGFVPEDRKAQGIFARQPVTWNVASAVLPRLTSVVYYVSARKLATLAMEYRDKLRIRLDSILEPIASLSGGGQQKVVLGRWLAARLRVLVLDEPTRGIDVATKAEFHQLIRQLADDGLAILVISSDLPEVMAVADRMLVMRAGRVAARFDNLSDVTPEELVQAAVADASAAGRDSSGMKAT